MDIIILWKNKAYGLNVIFWLWQHAFFHVIVSLSSAAFYYYNLNIFKYKIKYLGTLSLLFLKFTFNWRVITLQCCVGSCQHIHQHGSAMGIYMSPPPSASLPLPTPNHPLVLHSAGLNSLRNSTLPLATCFTRGNACDSTLLSHFFHPLLPTLCPQAVLYVCICIQFSSVQLSHSVASSFLWPHGLQHARLPCPSPTPGACSNSRPLSRWCHPTISSSVIPFSSYLPSIRVFSNEFVLHIRWPK